MQIQGRLTVLLLAIALSGCQKSPGPGQGGVSTEAAQQQLAQKYLVAVQSKDAARVRELLHPKVLACVDDASREYFDYLVSQEIENPPGADYKLTISALASGAAPPGLPADQFAYPVRPTHQLEIQWNRGPNDSVRVTRAIASNGAAWFVVYPCPSAAGVKFFHEELARGREQQERARALAAELKEPLKTQMKELLKQGRKLDAAMKYRSATGADLATAMRVADALQSAPH